MPAETFAHKLGSMKSSGPNSKFSQEALALSTAARPRAHAPEMRATLEGLEVLPTHFDQWLNAGGERRRKPRNSGTPGAKR